MSYHKFGPDDVFYNQIKAFPQQKFLIYDLAVYHNNQAFNPSTAARTHQPIDLTTPLNPVVFGDVSLYELNVGGGVMGSGREYIYPFVTKQGSQQSFATISTTKFNTDYAYGDTITGVYPLTSSIRRGYYGAGTYDTRLDALRTTLDDNRRFNPHYEISSSIAGRNLKNIALNIIEIPSIFYGSSIKKGTVNLEFYHSSSLIARAQDIGKNGSLVDTFTGSAATGSVVGFVLYNEGFIFLTSSVVINAEVNDNYQGSATTPAWIYFADYGDSRIPYTGTTYTMCSSSYVMEFSGTTYTPVITMFANAPKNAVNVSANKTFLNYSSASLSGTFTGSSGYEEPSLPIVNVVSSSFNNASAPFEKTVYISEVCLYDEEYNKVGVAKLAKPVEKKTSSDLTFKLKLDI